MQKHDYFVRMSDDVEIAMRVYSPDGELEPRPTLLAVSPYRFDNDELPKTHTFMWHEMGPFQWYVEEHAYTFVRVDLRGTGRSQGAWSFLDRRDRRDLYELVEWIAEQPWSNGKIGGIGQSYYAMTQWAMASEQPPHLTCIAPYDGLADICTFAAHNGGIPSTPFLTAWWVESLRPANERPYNDVPPHLLPGDFPYEVSQHPVRDEYWAERTFMAELAECTIPVYAVGAWSKLDLHTGGLIDGFQHVCGPKKLRLTGSPNALTEFSSPAFHERVMLPFYDWALKGLATDYGQRPAVEFDVLHADRTVGADQWPPRTSKIEELRLATGPTESVTSLNDGRLVSNRTGIAGATSYEYPDPEWMFGNVVMTAKGIDRVRRVLTFTSEPLEKDLTIGGPSELILYLSSTRTQTDIVVKLAEQLPLGTEDRAAGRQPDSIIATKGWLRSSHRHAHDETVTLGEPIRLNDQLLAMAPGEIYELHVPLMPVAHRFAAGSRIRVEISNTDSKLTDRQFYHLYSPDQAGADTIHHSDERPSRLLLTVLDD